MPRLIIEVLDRDIALQLSRCRTLLALMSAKGHWRTLQTAPLHVCFAPKSAISVAWAAGGIFEYTPLRPIARVQAAA
jgi:hypothetical protein